MSPLPSGLGLPSFDSTIGAVYLGMVVGVTLFGLTVYQAYRYFTLYYPTDTLLVKGFIITIFVLWVIVGYHYLVTEAFSVPGLLGAHWSVRLTILVTGFTVFVPQTFYAHRVYSLGPQYRWLAVPAVISMVTGLSFAIAAGIESYVKIHYITDYKRVSWLVSIAYGFAVGSDAILTGALVYVLRRSRTGSRRGDTVISILLKYVINTGLLTSVFSALVFIFAIILPGNLVYAGISIVGAKIYANSVLAVVNSRKSLDKGFFDDDFTVPHASEMSRARAGVESSLVWNVQQRATCATESFSVSQGMTGSRTTDPVAGSGDGQAKAEKSLC